MKKLSMYQMSTCAIMAALMCVLGPFSLPIGPVPVSLTNLVICVAVYLLGAKLSTVSVLLYLLLGAVGLPVFSGAQGGLGKIVGPTGGYLVGFIFLALIGGLIMEKVNFHIVWSAIGLVIATAVLYVFGTVWFMILMKCDLGYAMGACVVPFIPLDLIKIVIATLLGKAIRMALSKAGLLPKIS